MIEYSKILKQHCLLEASAGTGKTYSIVELFKALVQEEFLYHPERLSKVIFLTFTNKAIEELRNRIWQRFMDIYQEQDDCKDKDCWMKILLQLPSVRITTIQSFFQSMISSLDPIKSQGQDLEGEQSKETVILYRKIREYFLDLNAHRRTHSILMDLSKEQIDLLLVIDQFSLWGNWSRYFQRIDQEPIQGRNKDPYVKLLSKYQRIVFYGSKKESIPCFSHPFLTAESFLENEKKLQESIIRLEQSGLYEEMQKIQKSNADLRELMRVIASSVVAPTLLEKVAFFAPLKKRYVPIFSRTQKYQDIDFSPMDEVLEALEPFRYQIFMYIVSQVGEDITIKHPEQYGFLGALHLTNQLASSDDTKKAPLPFYSHVFFDEFQDTNVLEWETVKSIFFHSQHRPRFFLVGDPKQLIYQFRSSNIHGYERAKREILDGSLGEVGSVHELSDSYRTAKILLQSLNSLFSTPSFWGNSYHPIHSQVASEGNEGLDLVSFDHYQGAPSKQNLLEELANDFAKDILRHWHTHPHRTVAVLSAQHSNLLIIAKSLKQFGIPYIYVGQGDFMSSLPARQIRLLLHALLSFGDMVDQYLLLHSPFFNIPDDIPPIEALNDLRPKLQYYRDLLQKRRWALWRLEILKHSALKNKVEEKEYKVYEKIFDQILEKSESFSRGISDAIEFLKSQDSGGIERRSPAIPAPHSYKVVELLTIHASKGLEYDHVYLMRNPISSGQEGKGFSRPYVKREWDGDDYNIIFILDDQEEYKEWERKEASEEQKNLFYVALTRAKRRLILPYKQPPEGKGESLGWFLNQVLTEFLAQEEMQGITIRHVEEGMQSFKEDDGRLSNSLKEERRAGEKLTRPWPLLQNPYWEMVSYTSISKEKKGDSARNFAVPMANSQRPIFLPSGKNTGIFLHTLLEEWHVPMRNTREDLRQYVYAMIRRYSFGDISLEILRKILHETPLSQASMRLYQEHVKDSSIRFFLEQFRSSLLAYENEWEGEEDTEGIFAGECIHILTRVWEHILPGQKECLGKILSRTSLGQKEFTVQFPLASSRQFVESKLDFIFLGSDQRFYFLDWKTDSLPTYEPSHLKSWTLSEYDIQWKLYIVAMVRFLKSFLKDFSYEKDIGGFYYFYIRGIYEEGKGVYFHPAPSEEEFQSIEIQANLWGEHA